MNNDLISREALKNNIDKFIGYLDEDMIYRIKVVIDNTPTVETHDTVNMYCDKDTQIIVEQIRPQGEWVKWNFKTFGALGDWEYKCSNCEKVYGGEYNFCPNCGADMQKGGTE